MKRVTYTILQCQVLAQNFLNYTSRSFNNQFHVGLGDNIWRGQNDMITILTISPAITGHQGDIVGRLQSSRVKQPSKLFRRWETFFGFFVFDKFHLRPRC